MPAEIELNPKTYFQILHGMLRHDGSEAEAERAAGVIEWVDTSRRTIDMVTDAHEMRVLAIIWTAFNEYRSCPTRLTLATLIREEPKFEGLMTLLEDYDRFADRLPIESYRDMEVHLALRVKDWERVRVLRILEKAGLIVEGGMKSDKPKMPDLRGTRDALTYIVDELGKGVLVDDVRKRGGRLENQDDELDGVFYDNQARQKSGGLNIPTGIPLIDKHTGGLRRKTLVGVLGYTGQRKSAVIRTIGYTAAAAGHSVLHIPLESDLFEELSSYYTMHAHMLDPLETITVDALQDGLLIDKDFARLTGPIRKDLKRCLGQNLMVQEVPSRSWAEVKSLIKRESEKRKLDLVIIDYLTLLEEPGSRDAIGSMNTIIKEAKALALALGFCLLTPVQGSRTGFKAAQEADGAWDASGVYQHSEFERSADNLYYVYFDEVQGAKGQLKFGSCKMRRGANLASDFLSINLASGMVKNSDVRVETPLTATRKRYVDDALEEEWRAI